MYARKIGAATVKITTERLPRSLIALDIELDREQVDKGLERAARRFSQKYTIPGFRKGKAPRFIIENYFGRPALLEEAGDDILNKAFQLALEQEKLDPVGKVQVENINLETEPYTFRVTVPVAPTITLPAYRDIRVPIEIEPITEQLLDSAMRSRRDKHAVLRELDEDRPAQEGDELSAELEAFVDGEPLEPRPEGQPLTPSTLILEPNRLADGLYEGLLGTTVGQTLQIISHMPDDHTNEKLRGKEITFEVHVLGMKERLPADWAELPTLEEFDGTLEELREKTRGELAENARTIAERDAVDTYIRLLLEQSQLDIPDALIEREADSMLKVQEQEYSRYGIKPEQVYEYRGQKREDLLEELKPEAERRVKTSLALQGIVRAEGITVSPAEVDAEVESTLAQYDAAQREQVRAMLSTNLRSMMADTALDKKLRDYIVLLATGVAPSQQDGNAAIEIISAEDAPAEIIAAELPIAAESPVEIVAAEDAPAEQTQA
jgi:trigger factor